ncbi:MULTISPECIES: DUF7342 family protein [Natrialbaceae]|uniref:DUF7342 family protein n=1 Tax=Natrialbaceae TaxID=1644061 RepID=UPI00207C1ED8|nr:site-specific integrase [Natronococcus sp. CG52]
MEWTVRGHRYRTNHFVRWCDEKDIDNMNDLTGRHVHEYRLWRKEDGDLNTVSLQTQMCTIRVFLRWCGSIEAVDPDLHTKVMVPQVPPEEQQRDELESQLTELKAEQEELAAEYNVGSLTEFRERLATDELSAEELREHRNVIATWEAINTELGLVKHALQLYGDVVELSSSRTDSRSSFA